tara:strand:- start:581 stop:1606 length:1026 start_codon:yes stop_codon:yes gene_type:complete
MFLGIWLAERGWIPDFLLRIAVKFISKARIKKSSSFSEKLDVISSLRDGPIAELTPFANKQHYEVPPAFFEKVLGSKLKYSCSLFSDNQKSLNDAETEMLKTYIERANIRSKQEILDLGCGWGSFSLYAAQKFSNSNFTAVSNSDEQINFIKSKIQELGLTNLLALKQDINQLNLNKKFDRIVSIEMFEHMRNYKNLLQRLSNLMTDDGLLFVHIFCHRQSAYFYEIKNQWDWMTKYFFTGGIMPSKDIFEFFDEDLTVAESWEINGKHYSKTSKSWLKNIDKNSKIVKQILNQHYDEKNIWFNRWRIFFLACEEFFKINDGKEWFVSHYLLEKKNKATNK